MKIEFKNYESMISMHNSKEDQEKIIDIKKFFCSLSLA